jgi:hypothetical protein
MEIAFDSVSQQGPVCSHHASDSLVQQVMIWLAIDLKYVFNCLKLPQGFPLRRCQIWCAENKQWEKCSAFINTRYILQEGHAVA